LSYRFQNKEAISEASFEVVDEEEEVDDGSALGRLGNLLYNLENLRKREGDTREED
jgi:tRNA (guanine-N(7)-)-methyltransferase subunit TRM82